MSSKLAAAQTLRRGATRARVVLVTMGFVAVSASLVAMGVLYTAGAEEQWRRMQELARSQADLIDAVATFDAVESRDANPQGAWIATLGQVAEGFRRWQGQGTPIDLFVIGNSESGPVVHVQNGSLLAPQSQPVARWPSLRFSDAALGKAGIDEYRDDAGEGWFLVHEPIPSLRMAVAVRLNRDVVTRPLRHGLWVSGVACLILIGLGAILVRQTNVRTVAQLSEELSKRLAVERELAAHQATLEHTVTLRTAELERAQAELVKADRMATIGQLTAKVSHELRNPLGTVRASLHSLRQSTAQGERFDRVWARAERNVERCNRIIEELLSYTRPRPMQRDRVDVSALLRELLEDYHPPSGVTVDSTIPDGIEWTLDSEDLRRIVLNLLGNAAVAVSGQSTPRVHLSAAQGSEKLVICVEDWGSGMSPEVQQRAFEPLFSTRGFGVGLGLPIVRELTERNWGVIELDSSVGAGTRATVRFAQPQKRGTVG